MNNNYKTHQLYAIIAGIMVLIISGIGYRFMQNRLQVIVDKPITLKIALENFPKQIGPWKGEDIPIPLATLRTARNDDYVSRIYQNPKTGQKTSVYISFSGRPRTMSGHRPQVCYPASGWQHESTERIEITSRSGLAVPCLLHRFFVPEPEYKKAVVLNYYILNGVITDEESGFSGLSGRTPNIENSLATYVAQIQFRSDMENSVRITAEDFTDLILTYFPDTKNVGFSVPQLGLI